MSDQQVSPEWVIQLLREIAIASPVDVMSVIMAQNDPRPLAVRLAELPAPLKAAIRSIKFGRTGTSIEMHSKTGSLELIGRALAMFTDVSVLKNSEPLEAPPDGASTQANLDYYMQMIGSKH